MTTNHLEFDEHDLKAKANLERPTLQDRLHVVGLLALVPILSVWWTVRFFTAQHTWNYPQWIFTNTCRLLSTNCSITQFRVLAPAKPLREEMRGFLLKSKEKQHNNYNGYFQVDGASARWLHEVPDRKPEDPVVLYLHGGAFCLSTTPIQLRWCSNFVDALRHFRVSMLVLDYTVSPNARWPTQYEEAVATYQQLQKSCSKIVVLGDSAGGNLAAILQLWCHEQKVAPPFGTVLVSPWVEMMPRSTGSYVNKVDSDYLLLPEYVPLLYASREQMDDPHVCPNRGSAEVWKGVFGPRTLEVWGADEWLKDTCVEFARKTGIVDTFEQRHGAHDTLLLGFNNDVSRYIVERLGVWLGL